MENPHGTLWKGELDGIAVAIYECELPRPVQRRVLLAVDSTDSCWQASCTGGLDALQPEIGALLSSLSEVLEPGDECSIWLFGRTDPALRAAIAPGSRPGEIKGCLERGISPVLGGTWLEDTLRAMRREADAQRSLGMAPSVLVVTDGEIFDWEALPQVLPGLSAGLVELGTGDHEALTLLRDLTVAVPTTREGLRDFLALPECDVRLLVPGWAGRLVARFSDTGEFEPGPPLSVPDGTRWVRLAFLGGPTPRPVLVIERGTEECRVDELEIREIKGGIPRHFEEVLDQLRANCWSWDHDQLRRLATKIHTGEDEEAGAIACRNDDCPAHGKGVSLAQLRLYLFCPSCQSLLLGEGRITRSELERSGGPLVWQVPLDRAGRPGEPVASPSHAGGPDVCCIQDDEDGRRLEIRLVSKDYV